MTSKIAKMDFLVKKTYELTTQERVQLHDLFCEVFQKERPIEHMFNQYTENALGYSYHSLFITDGCIKGAATYVPSYFIYNGEKMIFATGIDVMIDEQYRNFYEFRKIIKNVFKILKSDGIPLIYGYPNDNSHPVYKTAGLMSDIDKMFIYCLPYRIGGIKHSLKAFNFLSTFFCQFHVWLSSCISSKKVAHFLIEKDKSYNLTRYKRLDGEYSQKLLSASCTLYYKITSHEGVRTAFIIDITEKSAHNFTLACRYLIKEEGKNFDLILYPGFLPFKHHGMLRLPRQFEPKNFHFAAQILDNTKIGNDVWNIKNWDTNLSMYDLI